MNATDRGEWTSASNALADQLCPGRYQAQLGLPELAQTEEGQSGSVIHALWTQTDPQRKPTPEEIERAEVLQEQEQAIAQEFFPRRDGLIRIVERRLWHEFPNSMNGLGQEILKTSGQFDVVLVYPKSRRALILDGKSGWLPVSSNPSNLQLRRLAALLWLQIDSLEIGVGILKPFGKPEPVCVYTVEDLQQSVVEMEEDVRQSHTPSAPRIPGEEQCRFCRVRETCSSRLTWLSPALPAVTPLLPLNSARDWTPAQRALFLEREKEARDWLEARKAELKLLLAERPDSVPGYGLKKGRTLETISDPQEVMKRFCNGLGGTVEAFMRCIKVGRSALKEEVRKLSGQNGRGLEAKLDSLLAGCVETGTSAPTIERLKGGLIDPCNRQGNRSLKLKL